jgi:hypothetical protein
MVLLFGSILAVVTTLMSLEWNIAYHRQTKGAWRRSGMGRHMMAFAAALSAVFLLASARFITVDVLGHTDPGWFQWLRLVVFTSIPIVIGWRRVLLARAQGSQEGEAP